MVLDTRTQRAYDSDTGAARLMGRKGFDRVAELVRRSGHRASEPLVVVSATPICGLELHERSQKLMAAEIGPYEVDFEAWHSNLCGLVDLMRFLGHELEVETAVVLSGDVHYGMTVDVRFTVGARTIHLAQLVSSGLKHSGPVTKTALHLVGRLAHRHRERLGWAGTPRPDRLAGARWHLVLRTVNTDAWDRDGPVFLSPALASKLGIDEPPDYREVKTYLRPHGSSSPLVGKNNVGSVTLDGPQVTHRLISVAPQATVYETHIDLASPS